jgi:hypothetical protein
MRIDQYSSRRNVRPGFPAADEIKKTTEAWKGDALAERPGCVPKAKAEPDPRNTVIEL